MPRQSGRPQQRLLYDEDVSPKVARALAALDFRVSHVGGDGQPRKNSDDQEVLAHAMTTNQVVVTSNHDMIMLCAEKGVSVVWLDPHRRHLRIDEQAALAFAGVVDWCGLLESAAEPVCIRVLRTRVHIYPVAEGSALAERRYRAIQKRKAQQSRRRKATAPGQLATDDAATEAAW